LTTDSKYLIEVKVGNSIREFSNVEDVFGDSFLPDMINEFDIFISGEEGEVLISNTGSKGNHQLVISGEDNWFQIVKTKAIEFSKYNETSIIRSAFYGSRIFFLQILLLGGILGVDIKFIWPWLGVPIYYHMTWSTAALTVLLVGTILGIEFYGRMNPYAAIVKKSFRSPLSRVYGWIMVLSSIASLVWIGYQILSRGM